MFLIALVEKLMPESQLTIAVFSLQQIIFQNGMASAFPLEQLLWGFWQIKNDTLTGVVVLWVIKWLLPSAN
jgi:hypothetical protein